MVSVTICLARVGRPPPEQYVRKKRRADRKLDPDPCFSHIRREGSAALQSCNNREPFCAERQ